jgi:hypothetical protein
MNMRVIAAASLVVLLSACAAQQPQQIKTVTVTKTVNVYPPDSLYGLTSGCRHSPSRKTGTVNDLADALISERAAVDVCLGDRAALRNWVKNSKTGE